MNLSKATRECKNLQREMREVMNEKGKTQLHYFCEKGMKASVVRMLEMRSINVEGRQYGRENKDTCLVAAACNGHLSICRLLIDKGAQVAVKDSAGWTPLHYAADQGRVDIVRLLCDRGADTKVRDCYGYAPLHRAVIHGRISVVKELIEERNAEINARDDDGRTALMCARTCHKYNIVSYLLDHGGIDSSK